jgi:phosphatidate cytidylyltransferase
MTAVSPKGAPAGSGMSNLKLRVISGIVMIAGVLLLTWLGGIWYRLLCVAIAAGVLYEWTAMTLGGSARSTHRMLLAASLALVLLLLIAGFSAGTLLLVLIGVVIVSGIHAAVTNAGFWAVTGLAYAGLCAISLAFLRGVDAAGLMATLFLFAVVWATDILAYFTGRAIGGPKLAPSISPGKTWSGAIGGTIAAAIAGILLVAYVGSPLSAVAIAALVISLSIVSQAGDLFESRLKRMFGVKDSSQLIPGHGGVMDRVDGLAVAAFVMFLVGAFMSGLDTPAHAFFNR